MIALVVVDLQRWMFRTPDRMAQVPGLLAGLGALASRFERENLPVYDVVTVHMADRSTWSQLMIEYDHACLIEGSADVEPVKGYAAPSSAVRIVKTQNSAFLKTDFEARLRADGVRSLMLAGVFMDGCIGLTAADAAQRRFGVTCLGDAIGHVDPDMRRSMETWLHRMYEIEQVRTAAALERVRA